MLLSIRTLNRIGLLPPSSVLWPPSSRRPVLESQIAALVIRPAARLASRLTLELADLPRPNGGTLSVPIERLPFHRSPGRWHFRCPVCGRLKGVLVEIGENTPRAPLPVRQIGWACRTCAGLPKSRAWPLTVSQRLDNALDRAGEIHRRPGEKARDWRRRRARAAKAEEKASAAGATLVGRLTS